MEEVNLFPQDDDEKWAVFEDASEAQGFTLIENSLMREQNLSLKAKAVYGLLKSFAWQDPFCFPGQKTLVDCSSDGIDALKSGLKECKSFGLIDWKKRGQGKTNLYIFKSLRNREILNQENPHSRNREIHNPHAGSNAQGTKTQFTSTQDDPLAQECVRILEEIPAFPRKDMYDKMLKKINLFPDVDAARECRGLVSWDADHPGETKSYWGRLHTRFENRKKWDSQARTPNQPSEARTSQRRSSGDVSTTPPAGVQALRDAVHPRLGYHDLEWAAEIAEEYDFTLDEQPPWWIMKKLGNDQTVLKQIRREVRNAL